MVTQDYLKRVLIYNEFTGIFLWAKNGKKAGHERAKRDNRRYIEIGIKYKRYKAHRLAWLYIYGEWPKNQIDHIDGNGLNNKINNLRDVTPLENSKNRQKQKNSTTGCTGVYPNGDKWRVEITENRKTYRLGIFDSFFDACCARKSAERKLNFHENHGM